MNVNVTINLSISKNGSGATSSGAISKDMTASVVYQNVQTVGTSSEALDLGDDMGNPPGVLFLKNLDATNFIEIALDNGNTQKVCKLLAGESNVLCPSTKTLYAKADTAPCALQVIAADI